MGTRRDEDAAEDVAEVAEGCSQTVVAIREELLAAIHQLLEAHMTSA